MPRLDKTNYLRGLQCLKLLWHSFNRRELIPTPDASAQAIFNQGRAVGHVAQRLFPGGIDLGQSWTDLEQAIARTRQALQSRGPMFEATFASGHAFARVDLLVPVGVDRWDVCEVKSSTSAKAVYLHDLAFQVRVLRDAGVNVRRAVLVHINNTYVRHGDIDINDLFVQQHVTDAVDEILAGVEDNIDRMLEVISLDESPVVPIGPHCDKPYTCPLHDQCWAHLPMHNVTTLVRVGGKSFRMMAHRIFGIVDIPDDFKLTPRQEIQRQAVISSQPHIDHHAVAAFLARLKFPVHYLDFETFGPAIPLFDGTRPFEAVPFQFSLHIQQAPGAEPQHHSYLAKGTNDPRQEFMQRLRALLGDTGPVLVWNASFEKSVLARCAEMYTEFKPWVASAKRRIVDLHLPFKRFDYYHPDQRASTSIKAVMPALTGRGYDELEIQEGSAASQEYMRVTFTDVSDDERQRVRRQLEEYCGRDTEGMVWIVESLRVAVDT